MRLCPGQDKRKRASFLNRQKLCKQSWCFPIEPLENRRLLSSTSLDFATGSGGLAGSGFTGVFSSGFVAADVTVRHRLLRLTSTAGDLTTNNQDNALSVALNGTQDFIIQTRLDTVPFTQKDQSAGIFIGLNQNNYVKFVVGDFGHTGLQLGSAIGGSFSSAPVPHLSLAHISTMDLRLVGDASTGTLTAQYRINSSSDSAWVTYGQTTNAAVFNASAQAGILSTNYGSREQVSVTFASFIAVNQQTPGQSGQTSGPMTVGANTDATPLPFNQATAQIAINPANPNNVVVVGQNVENSSSIPVAYSFNGGASWSLTSITGSTDGLSPANPRVDARIAFDSFGNAYVAYEVAAHSNEIRIVVARSSNGGASFSGVTTAVGGAGSNVDYPNIATGPASGNNGKQAIWITYTNYANPNQLQVQAVYATSSGLGQLSAFSKPEAVSTSGGDLADVAVSATGQVAVAYETEQNNTGPDDIMVSVNANGTGSGGFGADILASKTDVGPYDPIPAQPHRTIDAVPQVAFDRSGDSTNGRLYLLYTDAVAPGSSDTNIELRYSDNLGAAFSRALRVNDNSTSTSAFLPALAVDQTTGDVGISWLDARNSAKNNTAQEYATISTTHGASVFANVLVSDGTSNQAGADADGQSLDFGDLTGAAFSHKHLIVAWADNSNALGDNPNGSGSYFDLYTGNVSV